MSRVASLPMLPIVVAMTGASGAAYALRLLELLLEADRTVYLSISPSARAVLQQELGLDVSLESFAMEQLWIRPDGQPWWHAMQLPAPRSLSGSAAEPPASRRLAALRYWHYLDFMSPMASGSHLTEGMVICPCSGGTLSGVASGASQNLIERAAEVHLKERRKLILVPRETPLSNIALSNMQRAAEAGAVVLPAMPGWYHGVRNLWDVIDFMAARMLDLLAIEHGLLQRWGEEPDDAENA